MHGALSVVCVGVDIAAGCALGSILHVFRVRPELDKAKDEAAS
jgi:hypothetical protein